MLKEFVRNEEEAKRALLGTILADGSICKERKGCGGSLEITHTSKNLDYLMQVKEIIEIIPDTICRIKEHNKKTENKTYTLFRLTTNTTEWLTSIRNNIYDENRVKVLRKDELDKFSDLSLFLAYLDDGTLKVRFYEGTIKVREVRVTFCFDSFTLNEIQIFREWLKNKYSIDTKYYRHSKNLPINRGFRVWTNTENTKKLMNVFDKFYNHVPSMNYKFLKYYSL